MRGTVESRILRIVNVRRNRAAHAQEEIVFHAMRGSSEMQAFRAHCLGQIADHIAVRSHLGRRPVAKTAVVHGEAIVMFGDRNDVFRSRFLEQTSPGSGIEVLGLEHGDEIFVTELVLRAVGRDVVFVLFGTLADTCFADTTRCRKQERSRRPNE